MRLGSLALSTGGIWTLPTPASDQIFDFPLSLVGNGLLLFCRHELDKITLADGLIAQVDDQSGNAWDATQPTSARQPEYGEFDGRGFGLYSGGEVMLLPSAFALSFDVSAFSMWTVIATDSTSAAQITFSVGGGSDGVAIALSADAPGKRAIRCKGSGTAIDADVTLVRELILVTRSAGRLRMYVNNVEQAIDTPLMTVNPTTGSAFFGSVIASPLLAFEGAVGEWAAVDRPLTSDERDSLFTDYAAPYYTI